ncbi:MAG: PIG-L family deacetylase [Gemmatimonadetes bacterium]|nr:PIG-L family deacetylase [Gemmatimonadota bacterium]MYB60574.1 PIG-L family deacetylase [Gemmatimonadota bacterium]MYB62981.1 PIG-L family deacetylase [Gemmatimonadota bacterium]
MHTRFLLCLLLAFFAPPVAATTAVTAGDIRPVPDGKGTSTLAQAVLRLPVVASMLHTGAHPDDENSALVAYVSRGLHARTAYLSLNRGEGGQNLIGPELYDAIGVIRTEELLTARRFDGAEQFFTRTYDFGFSKSAEETLEYWNHDEMLLSDVVRVIRRFRPDVIVSVFADSPRDGHGHHQAAGRITREAFFVAADPERFPEHLRDGLRPWQARKLYINNTRASFDSIDSLVVDVGAYSPVLDRSYRELGLAGRSMHRSQDMGTLQPKGPATTKIKLVAREGMADADGDAHLFDGLDTTFMRFHAMAGPDAGKIPGLAGRLERMDALAREAVDAYRPLDPPAVLDPVLEGLRMIRALRSDLEQGGLPAGVLADMLFLLDQKEEDFANAAVLALGMAFEVLTSDDRVVPGNLLGVHLVLLNRSARSVRVTNLALDVPEGWTAAPDPVPARPARQTEDIGYNESFAENWRVEVPPDAGLTRPYWHRHSLNDPRVVVDDTALIGLPWRPQPVIGRARFLVDGVEIEIRRPAQYRFADRAFGEIRRELQVVPALSVTMDPQVVVAPSGRESPLRFSVSVISNVDGGIEGGLSLEAPEGWEVSPGEVPLSFSGRGQAATYNYSVVPARDARDGAYDVRVVAKAGGNEYREGYEVIAYPHIEPRHLYRGSASVVQVAPVDLPDDLRVGYIMGSGDQVPLVLEQMGLQVRLLTGEDLATADLDAFDLIIAGIRAYEVREDLIAVNQRLLDYVEDGGVYIVQYNKYAFNLDQYGPFPFQINRPHDRVTREDAPVDILVPDHPVFNRPNRITDADFEGWVQERGLYFQGEWDPRYTPLMASQDPGEPPRGGGLLEARYGKGRYIYTGYAWFRQLPAGVPGAVRLFANLIGLAAENRAR